MNFRTASASALRSRLLMNRISGGSGSEGSSAPERSINWISVRTDFHDSDEFVARGLHDLIGDHAANISSTICCSAVSASPVAVTSKPSFWRKWENNCRSAGSSSTRRTNLVKPRTDGIVNGVPREEVWEHRLAYAARPVLAIPAGATIPLPEHKGHTSPSEE